GSISGERLAMELLNQVGHPKQAHFGNCYGRTSNAIWSKHHPAEFVRVIAELAQHGRVELASGQVVTWGPEMRLPTYGELGDIIWGHVQNVLRLKVLANPTPVFERPGFASRGEMANLLTRLTGVPHVNVKRTADMSRDAYYRVLGRVLQATGPLLC